MRIISNAIHTFACIPLSDAHQRPRACVHLFPINLSRPSPPKSLRLLMCFPFTSDPHLSRVFTAVPLTPHMPFCSFAQACVPMNVLKYRNMCSERCLEMASARAALGTLLRGAMRISPLRRLASRAALTTIPGGQIQHVILATTAMLGRAFLSATTRARWVEASLADVFGDVPDIVRERFRRPVSAPSASGALTFFAPPFARIPVLACLH